MYRMQKEHHLHVEKAIIHYVKDFANVEEVLAEMTKEARDCSVTRSTTDVDVPYCTQKALQLFAYSW